MFQLTGRNFQFLDLVEPLLLPARVLAVPAGVARFGRETGEVLISGVRAIVGHASQRPGLVGAVAALEPGEARAQVFRDAKAQALLAGGGLPGANDVALGPHVDGVPAVQSRVPEEEVVVVGSHADEVFGAGLFVEGHQAVGIPLLGLPERDDVLVTVGGGVAKVLPMILVLAVALLVHVAGIPVAVHRHGLRTQWAQMPNLASRNQSGHR